ncbi:hypothetical protein WKH56_20825 [Priestia sp. SB1]|uniref:hypothetical protein n=1 Tax=Priestia sp. SB1 TaxID=3132359 RepID=UPI003182291C
MPTPYEDVYERFMGKIYDYSYLKISQEQLESIILPYLKTSIVKFKKCRQNLKDRDDVTGVFNTDLTEEEQEILSQLLLVEYLTPKLNHSDNLESVLSPSEYARFSQANKIKELRELRASAKSEANKLIMDYSWDRELDGLL